MAKTKTPKMEKTIDITPKPEKITEDQLTKMQSLVKNVNLMHHEIGVIESKKHSLIHNMIEYQKSLFNLQDEFKKDYGTDDVSVQDGTINYQKENGETDKKD